MEIQWYIYLGLVLVTIGITGVVTRRNAIVVLMSVELMLIAVDLLLVAFSKMHLSDRHNVFEISVAMSGQLFVLFILIVSAIEVCVGLAIVLAFFRNTKSVDINFLRRLKN